MSASNNLEDLLLAASLTGTTYTGNATVYMSLYSTTPTDASAGTELSGNGYSRQAITFTVSTGNGYATNSADVTFGPATANWTTARGWGVCDAPSSGNLLYYGSLAPTQTLKDTYYLTFGTGNVTVNMD